MDAVSNAAAWGLILGIATPYLVAVLNQPSWSANARRIMSVLVATGVGVANTMFNVGLELRWDTALASVAAVLIASQTAYTHLLKPLPSGVSVLENITSGKAPVARTARH